MASKIEFKRGDDTTHYFRLPSENWTPGGTLTFVAKSAVDDDMADNAAVIDVTFNDSVAVDDGTKVTYTMFFPAAATDNITSDGKSKKVYKGEFQYINGAGHETTFPSTDKFLEVVVYFDLKRGNS